VADSARTLKDDDRGRWRPIYCVWEITLRCDQSCAHCGSRAGDARPDELDTAEMLAVAESLVRLGTREVTLIGGEAYLRGDCYDVIAFLHARGVRVTMQTGGRGLTETRCRKLKEAGLAAIGVSIDGPQDVHDVLRANVGSHAAALRGVDHAVAAGFLVTSNSQINRLNKDRLHETAAMMQAHGVRVWRCQLTAPMGNAADRPDWILQPWMILEVIDTLAEIQKEAQAQAERDGRANNPRFRVSMGNNLGYYGPHEELLRGRPGAEHRYWQSCQAGRYVMGIESNGLVKACPSLPTRPYDGGNVRDLSLEDIWADAPEIAFTRESRVDELWGRCASCYYAETCQAGCSFTAHSTLGRRGNNPFCWYRADRLRREGLRERLVHKVRAPGDPYDFGAFDLVEEPWSEAAPPPMRRSLPVL
jgi:radical SAM protein with 4Fe4S-binding SPASM domain